MMQIFDTNFIDTAATKTASSENASYPASNVYDIQRRRLTWRTAGYWNVVSPSNMIVFREASAGADITATVAAAEYTTDATFLAAVAAALNAATTHGATYTVTRDSTTQKIKITQSAAGTASAFELRWVTASAFGTILGFDTSANDTGATTYTADLLRIHTEEFLVFDFGADVQPTGMVAVTDRNVGLNISPTATITLMANNSNAWGTPAESFTVTWRDFVLCYLNKDGIAALAGGYRYWKLQIIDNDNPDGYLELGAVFLGTHVSLVRGSPQYPFVTRMIDNSSVDYSESGQAWVGKRPKTKLHTVDFKALTNADSEAMEAVWDTYGKDSSFFVALDPDSVFTADGLKRTALVKFNEEPDFRLISPGNWSCTWNLREEL